MNNQIFIDKAVDNLIDSQLRVNGIYDKNLLKAIKNTPRSQFVASNMQSVATIDRAIAVRLSYSDTQDRFMTAPLVFAKMIQALEIKKHHIVLDIACATGYSTAILAKLSMSVIAIEADTSLVERAEQLLLHTQIGNAAVLHQKNMEKGYQPEAPYDIIIIQGGVETIPTKLLQQLAEQGRLCAILVEQNCFGKVYLYKKNQGVISRKLLFEASHPIIEGFYQQDNFVF